LWGRVPRAERAEALQHLRDLAKDGALTLSIAREHPDMSEAAVLVDVLQG